MAVTATATQVVGNAITATLPPYDRRYGGRIQYAVPYGGRCIDLLMFFGRIIFVKS
jgi:hypothetical protein